MDEKALEYTRDHYNKHVVTISYEKVLASSNHDGSSIAVLGDDGQRGSHRRSKNGRRGLLHH